MLCPSCSCSSSGAYKEEATERQRNRQRRREETPGTLTGESSSDTDGTAPEENSKKSGNTCGPDAYRKAITPVISFYHKKEALLRTIACSSKTTTKVCYKRETNSMSFFMTTPSKARRA
jgi:hypothetical protein